MAKYPYTPSVKSSVASTSPVAAAEPVTTIDPTIAATDAAALDGATDGTPQEEVAPSVTDALVAADAAIAAIEETPPETITETPVIESQEEVAEAVASTPTPNVVVEEVSETVVSSGVLVAGTTSDVGTSVDVAPVVTSDVYAGTLIAGLGAESYTADAQEIFQQILATGSAVAKGTLADVLHYAQYMGPTGRQDAKTGSAAQVALYSSLVNCINNAGNDFQLMWAIILRIVFEKQDNGAFSDHLCFRFFPDMPLDTVTRTAFRNLLSIMTSTASASGRATALTQIDFQKALGKPFTDSGKSRLLAFYNV